MRHPNVVTLYESLETEVAYYLVLELIRGGEMKDYISKADRLTEKETKKFMRQLISSVYHIHSAGVVHRDLKVENIMLNRTGNIKIIDFGLSNCLKSLENKGGKGTQCGSPAYAAPELLANKGYDKRVDIWAIGINMFAMLVGKLPFKVKPFNLKKLYQKMVTGDMEQLPSGTSQEARDLLLRLLQPDPNDRISLRDCADHSWLAKDPVSVSFIESPNFPVNDDLNQEVIGYMEQFHNVNAHSLVLDLLTHTTNSNTATYHHMANKFERYVKENDTSKTSISTDQVISVLLDPKKDMSLTRRGSKSNAKVLKRRPKTAGTVTKRAADQQETKPTVKPRRNSVGDILKKPPDSNSKRQTLTASSPKQAFKTSKGPAQVTVTSSPPSPDPPEDSGFSGSRKMSTVSCRSSTSSTDQPVKSSTRSTASSQRQYQYRPDDRVNTVYSSTPPRDSVYTLTNRDGRVNWRQTSLLKTKHPGLGRTTPVALNRVQHNTVHFQTSSRSPDHRKEASNYSVTSENTSPNSKNPGYTLTYGATGIQWPPLRPSSRSERGSTTSTRTPYIGSQHSSTPKCMSYRWRTELHRAKVGINKHTTHVLKRNITFPETVYSPHSQYRTYTSR